MLLKGFILVFSAVLSDSVHLKTWRTILPYDGYSVYRLNVNSSYHLYRIKKLAEEPVEGVDVLSLPTPRKSFAEVMVAPEGRRKFFLFLRIHEFDYKMIVDSVGLKMGNKLLSSAQTFYKRGSRLPDAAGSKFLRYNEIVNKLKSYAKTNKLAQLELIGKTYENRSMYMIKITTDQNAKKPIILIEAGMHAREWAAPAAALYLIDQLLKNNETMSMIKEMDWYIIPVLNADGYEHSHESDRLWRKTKSINGNCSGVDGNRNFDFHWAESGVNFDPCSETYPGPSPFSEIEAVNLRNIGRKYQSRIHTFLSLHSYGGYIMYPWGYTEKKAKNWQLMHKCGSIAAAAIANVAKTKFQVGSTGEMLYKAAGGSDDYFFGVLKVPFAFTMELRRGGITGFDLPTEKLFEVSLETFEGIKALALCTTKYPKVNG